MKHTLGEGYFFPKYKGELTTEIKFGDKTVAEVLGYISSEGEIEIDEAKANAKLLSAAPELLEALQIVMVTCQVEQANKEYGQNENHWTNKVMQAIKKATE